MAYCEVRYWYFVLGMLLVWRGEVGGKLEQDSKHD
jgi:hypothetical protein